MATLSSGALVKGFVTLSGLSGASVGGYYVYSNVNSSGNSKTDKPSAETSAPSQPKVEVESLKVEKDFVPKTMDCFSTFFNGASFTKGDITKNQSDADALTFTMPTVTGDESKAEGCTVMKYSENSSDSSKPWKFESATVIKNGKVGVAVWLEVNSLTSDNQRYQIYLLEKASTGDTWSVRFGVVSNVANGLKEIKSPDDKVHMSFENNKWNKKAPSKSNYSGTWTSKTGGNKNLLFDGVFKDLKTDFKAKYTYKETKWTEEKTDVDRKKVLEDWFKPFEDKKGAWTTKSD